MRRDAFIGAAQRLGAGLLYAPSPQELAAGFVPDLSGNARDGELRNAAALVGAGLVDGAIAAALNGTNQSIEASYSPRTNLIPTPSPEPEGSVGAWATTGGFWNNAGATCLRSGLGAEGLVAVPGLTMCAQITTPGVAAAEGAKQEGIPVVKGTSYIVSAYMKGAGAGGQKVRLAFGNAVVGSAFADVTLTAKWQRYSFVFTAGESGSAAFACAVPLGSTLAQQWWVTGCMMEVGAVPGTLFPTVPLVQTGEAGFSGGAWESSSAIGAYAVGANRTFVGIARLDDTVSERTLFGSGGGSGEPSLVIKAGGTDLAWRADTSAGTLTFAGAWPGPAQPVFYGLVFDDVNDSVSLYINGVLIQTRADAVTYNDPGNLRLGVRNTASAPFLGSTLPFAVFPSALSADDIFELAGAAGLAPRPIPPPPVSPDLTVVSIAEGGEGRGYNLTEEIEGLSFSNVNPGGDEVCSFTLRRKWYETNPEISRGNLLRILCGVDVLWQGRVEETDRGIENTEKISVTAYGLGARLKDGNLQEIFIDGELGKWNEPSAQRKVTLSAGNVLFDPLPAVNGQDTGAALPALAWQYSRLVNGIANGSELWYYGAGIDLGALLYNYKGSGEDAAWVTRARLAPTDLTTSGEGLLGAEHDGKLEANEQSIIATDAGYKYAAITNWRSNASTIDPYGGLHRWEVPKVLGLHGLPLQGSWPYVGFTVDQMVGYILGLVPGVAVRRLDAQTFVIEQSTYIEPTPHEDAIRDLNRYENCDWGTWGPSSPLDRSVAGYFDFANADRETVHWFTLRSECDAEDLHSETATLYGKVAVVYTDEADIQRTVHVEIDVPDLDAAELSREYTMNIGTATAEIAQAEAEAFLARWGQFAPARGSFTVKQPIRHHRRGDISPLYMRADGSNVRIPDILPAATLFALDSSPDLRTTFPIKRVSIDASGEVPAASVEVDQADDSLSVLQSRSDLATSLIQG